MLITGEDDLRTPSGQSEEFFRALQTRGVPTAMVRLRNEPHGYFLFPSNFLRVLGYRESWFRRFVRPKP